MKSETTNLILQHALAVAMSVTMLAAPGMAQKGNAPLKTDSTITYHNGPVMQGYALENSTKCANTFGETYLAPNGARANIQVGTDHWLIQQNWVNSTRKGLRAIAPPQL